MPVAVSQILPKIQLTNKNKQPACQISNYDTFVHQKRRC